MTLLFFLAHSLHISFWIILFKYHHRDEPLAFYILPAFCVKILAGIAYGWLYAIYYGGIGDSLNFFHDAGQLAEMAVKDPKIYFEILFLNKYHIISDLNLGDLWLQPRALFLVKIISIFSLITNNNYWLIGFYFSLFSFLGMWLLANRLVKTYPQTKYSVLISLLFFPSVVFWSSGLNKESLVMGVIGFALARVIARLNSSQKNIRVNLFDAWVWIFSGFTLWLIKFYYLAALGSCLTAYFLTLEILRRFKPGLINFKYGLSQFALLFLVWASILGLGFGLLPGLRLEDVMTDIVSNHNVTYIFSRPEELIHYTIIQPRGYITIAPTLQSFLYNSPQALFSALYRPFLWEGGSNPLRLAMGLENLGLLMLSLYALLNYVFRKRHPLALKDSLLIWVTLLYIGVLYTILAFASPNFGSLARYKIAGLPFLIYVISIDFVADFKRIIDKNLPIIKKKTDTL